MTATAAPRSTSTAAPHMPTTHVLAGVAVAALWGVNFLALHASLEYLPPLFLVALRFLVLAVPVVLFVPRPDVPVRWLLLYGTGFGIVQFVFLFWAMSSGMPTGLASLVLQSSAPFTVLLGAVFLRERLSRVQLLGITTALVGMAVIAWGRSLSASALPVLLTVLGALGWAAGNIGSRQARSDSPMRLMLWMTVIPPLPMLAVSAAVEGPTAGWSALADCIHGPGWTALAGVAYTAVLGTLAGSGLWTWLMSNHPASQVAPFSLLVPVFGMSTAWLVLDERPAGPEWVGAALVLTGLVVFSGVAGRLVAARPGRRP